MNIFIIGIAGGTGRLVAQHLLRRGDSVTGLIRKSQQAGPIEQLGARVTLGDLVTISTPALAAAVRGADTIVFTAGAGDQDDDSLIDAIDLGGVQKAIAAALLGRVPRLLLVSVFPEAWRGADAPQSFEHYIRAKKAADVALVHSPIDWIILRPSALTDEPGTGHVSLSAAELHTTVSRDDVAAAIAALLHTSAISRRVLELTSGAVPLVEAVAALRTH